MHIVADIYIIKCSIPELLKENLKANSKTTRIAKSFKIKENIDFDY